MAFRDAKLVTGLRQDCDAACQYAWFVILTAAGCTSTTAEDPTASAMFRGGTDHTGVYLPTVGRELTGLEWRYDTEGGVVGSPVVLGDTLWIGSADGTLNALRVSTGDLLWRVDLGSPVASTAAVAGGVLIAGTRDGSFHGLASSTGARRWQVNGRRVALGPRKRRSRLLTRNRGRAAILAAGDGARALRPESGRDVVVVAPHQNPSSPRLGGKVFVAALRKIAALDLTTGATR